MQEGGYKPLEDDGAKGGRRKKQAPAAKANRLDAHDGLLDLATISHSPIPLRQWLVPDLIPMANVTQLSGDGGLGKSLLAMQLAVCCALRLPWLGIEVQPCRSLLIFCEDDEEEIIRRLYEVTAAYGASIEDLVEHVDIVSRVAEDSALMTYSRFGEELPKTTPLYDKIHASMVADNYGLAVLDSSHDLFIGNENDRTQVRQFVGSLRALCRINAAAVLLNSHPSMTGMNSGSGSSGSTAWNNAVRSRLYLTRPEGGKDKRYRVLKTMKANYAMGDSELALMWENGIMVPDEMMGTAQRAVTRMQTGQALVSVVELVRAMCERGTYPSVHDNHPKEYVVRLLMKEPAFYGYEKGPMTELVQRAIKERLLESIMIPGTRRSKFRQVVVPFGFRPPKQVEIDYAAPGGADKATPAGPGGPPPASEEDIEAMMREDREISDHDREP